MVNMVWVIVSSAASCRHAIIFDSISDLTLCLGHIMRDDEV